MYWASPMGRQCVQPAVTAVGRLSSSGQAEEDGGSASQGRRSAHPMPIATRKAVFIMVQFSTDPRGTCFMANITFKDSLCLYVYKHCYDLNHAPTASGTCQSQADLHLTSLPGALTTNPLLQLDQATLGPRWGLHHWAIARFGVACDSLKQKPGMLNHFLCQAALRVTYTLSISLPENVPEWWRWKQASGD